LPMTAAFAEAELAGNRVPQSAAGFGPLQAAAGAGPMAAAASAGQAAASEPRSVPMACKRSGVRIPIAPHKVPGQSDGRGASGRDPRSLDRHSTVVLDVTGWHRAARI